jgi:hypothetical protein
VGVSGTADKTRDKREKFTGEVSAFNITALHLFHNACLLLPFQACYVQEYVTNAALID